MKNKFLPVFSALLLFMILFRSQSEAQTIPSNANYSKHPYWIEMINDPHVNYFEAVKAYELFWEHRAKPMEEKDVIGEEKRSSEKQTVFQRWFRSKKERQEEENKKYILDIKKFEHWMLKVKPYVQEDGSILSNEELLKLWEEQKK